MRHTAAPDADRTAEHAKDNAKTPVRQLPVRMPEELYNGLKGMAYFTRRSMNEIVVAAIAEYLRNVDDSELDTIVTQAQDDYRQLLDKLADL